MTSLRGALQGAGCLAAFLALSSCGSDNDRLNGFSLARDVVAGATASVRAPQQPASQAVTRADLAQILTPVDLITVERFGTQAVIAKIATNAGVETWSSVDKKTVSFRSGLIVASRGLGDDLIGASVPTLSRIMGGDDYTRNHSWMRENDRVVRHDFTCRGALIGSSTVSIVERGYPVRQFRESCTGETGAFQNDYWVQVGGKLRQSRQFVSDGVGYVVIQHLSDGG
jgi:uncharacterized SAM-binding protein YcdF (DUF218 family)